MARAGFVRRFLKPCAVAACLAVLGACGGGGEPRRTVTTVTISSPTSTPKQGDTVQLTVVARDQFGDLVPGTTATWSSSAPAVATVSATGLLQALAGGTVNVTATISNVPGSLTLTITPRTVTTVTVTSPALSLQAGSTVQLAAEARDQFGDIVTGRTVTWSTADAKVATISPAGVLQAVATGTVMATATIDGLPGSLTLTVMPAAAASVTVSSPSATPQAGEAVQLTAAVRDRYGNLVPGVTVGWSTSDARIATVSTSGLLQALTPGGVEVTACASGVSGSLKLTVVPGAVASVTVSAPTLTPKEGDAVQLTAVARDQFGNIVPDVTATWSVSDATLAAVSTTGLLQTYATGTVRASASVAGTSAEISLAVSAIKVTVTFGAKEVMFSYATDRCYDNDQPDNPARAVRAEDGSIVLFFGQAPQNFVSRGADFNSIKRDCSKPVFVWADRSTPGSYENNEWLWSVYREGGRWHALIHNEFHDPFAGNCKVADMPAFQPCWYNSITYAVSTDGGRAFLKPSPPSHLVAPAPQVWIAPPQPVTDWYSQGYVAPTNIVQASDGYYYALMSVWFPGIPSGWCVIRTAQLDDPAGWRAWSGSGFNLRMTSPYLTGSPAPTCEFLQNTMASGHLVYSTYLNRYLHVAQSWQQIGGRRVCGIYFELSSDLVHWSEEQLLAETNAFGDCLLDPTNPSVLETMPQGYASVIDHEDNSTNFERAGRTPHLYYRRETPTGPQLIRVPITFTRLD